MAPDQEKRLEVQDLERALAKLPEEQRLALLLVGMEGMRYEETSAVLGVPVGTVRSRLSRGREAPLPVDEHGNRAGRVRPRRGAQAIADIASTRNRNTRRVLAA